MNYSALTFSRIPAVGPVEKRVEGALTDKVFDPAKATQSMISVSEGNGRQKPLDIFFLGVLFAAMQFD